MLFLDQNVPLRTDASFDAMENVDHHKAVSPLSQLEIGLVSSFPLDYMHLVCLGLVRRLLIRWKDRSSPQRLMIRSVNELSSCLAQAQSFWTTEFNRRPRSLSDIDRWKATEFHQFLLY